MKVEKHIAREPHSLEILRVIIGEINSTTYNLLPLADIPLIMLFCVVIT